MTVAAPAVLFRVPDDVGRHLVSDLRSFVLIDDPEDTQAAIRANEVQRALEAEAGSVLRYRSRSTDRAWRSQQLKEAERFAKVADQLAQALADLNARWSKGDVAT